MWAVARAGGGGEGGGAVGAVGAGGAGGRAGAAIEHYFLFSSLLSSEYGSMWAVGAVGVLEERKACKQWRGRVAVRAVGAVGAVRAGRAGAAIEHYFLFSSLLSGEYEYGSMWGGCAGGEESMWVGAVGAVGAVARVVVLGQQ